MATLSSSWLSDRFDRIDALTMRERAIGFGVVLAVLVYAWDTFLFDPLDVRRERAESEVESVRIELQALDAQTEALTRMRSVDPDAENRARLAELRTKAVAARSALGAVVEHLVPPSEMAEVLEAVLTRETGLRLLSLESLGAQSVATTAQPEGSATPAGENSRATRIAAARAGDPIKGLSTGDGAGAPITLFRHGFRMRLVGGYLDTLRYLQALESLSWRFMWDSVELDVVEHPVAEVTVTVYSMSLDESWMDV